MIDLKGKNAVVTGGARGIVFETSKVLLERGLEGLAILDISDASETVNDLKSKFGERNIFSVRVDVTKRSNVEEGFKEVIKHFNKIDIIIAGAGVFGEDNIDLIIGVNLLGVIFTNLVGLNYMSKEEGGNGGIICNIASVLGLSVLPSAPLYTASKHAVVGFTQSLADEMLHKRHGVDFITICPGLTDTILIEGFVEKVMFLPGSAEPTKEIINAVPLQSPAVCGRIIADVIQASKNSSINIIDDGKQKEIKLPIYWP